MIGQLPQGLFGLKTLGQAMPDMGTATAPTPFASPATQPFVWGQGGARMTPEQIAQRQQMASRMSANGMDFSPVQSWSQGAARVAQALLGGMEQKKLDAATQTNATDNSAAITALGTGANDQTIAAILGSPYASDTTRDYAQAQYKQLHPTPRAPGEFEQTLIAAGVSPGTPEWTAANQARLQNYTDPTVNIPLPGGRVYVGPRSGVAAATGGGGPASTGASSGAPAIGTIEDGFRFKGGNPSDQANWEAVGGAPSQGGATFPGST